MPTKKKAPVKKVAAKKVAAPQLRVPAARKVTTKAAPKKTVTQARSLHLGMHLIIAGSAIAVLLLLGIIERNTFATRGTNAAEVVPSTIGLEHNAPLSLSMLFAKKDHAGYVSITNESNETIHLSVPSDWTRTEVTGAEIKDVTHEIPVFGFTRWTLPGKAGIKMLQPESPAAIFFDSQSEATAAVDVKSIDLTTMSVSNKVVLVQRQTLVPLWGQE